MDLFLVEVYIVPTFKETTQKKILVNLLSYGLIYTGFGPSVTD